MKRSLALLALGVMLLSAYPVGAHGGVDDLGSGIMHDPAGNVEGPSDVDQGLLLARAGDQPQLIRSEGDDADAPYNVRFRCPNVVADNQGEGRADHSRCPSFVYDLEDLMGQPALVVDPNNPGLMAFNALHGGQGVHPPINANDPTQPAHQPPTPRSRWNLLHQPHTNFVTSNHGTGWEDQRYFAPSYLRDPPERKVFGEDNAATIDANGRLYFASLYSFRDPQDEDWRWQVNAWKHDRLNRKIGYTDYVALDSDNEFNRIESLSMDYSEKANVVVTLWLEHAGNASNGLSSFINVYTTSPNEGPVWDPLPISQRIGPCRAISNVMAFGRDAYVGCLPDDGYAAANASLDFWQIHAIDLKEQRTRHVAGTGSTGDHAIIFPRGPYGHMVFVTSGVNDEVPYVTLSLGGLGSNWTNPVDYGAKFTSESPRTEGQTLKDAWITAAAYTESTSYVHMIYMEVYEASDDESSPVVDSGVNQPTIHKTYAVVRPVGQDYRGAFDIQFGQDSSPNPTRPDYLGTDSAFFADLHDSIAVFHDPVTGKERIFVAYGEFGDIRFAEVVEQNALPPIPPVPFPAPAVAAPLAAANSALAEAAAGAVFGLMLLRLLMARKKAKVAAPS